MPGNDFTLDDMYQKITFLPANVKVTSVGGGSAPRIAVLASTATLMIDVDATDVAIVLALIHDALIANPTGTPNPEQPLKIRLKSASSQLLTWGTQFRAGTDLTPLPAATSGGGLTDRYGFIWNDTDSTWDYVAIAGGF